MGQKLWVSSQAVATRKRRFGMTGLGFMSRLPFNDVSLLHCGWAGHGSSCRHRKFLLVSLLRIIRVLQSRWTLVLWLITRDISAHPPTLWKSLRTGGRRTNSWIYIAMRPLIVADGATMRRRVPTTRRLTTCTRCGRVGFLQHLTSSSGIRM